MTWEGLNPPYATVVADPPWAYDEGWPPFRDKAGDVRPRKPLPYSSMSVFEIRDLPVKELVGDDAHLYLWTTNRYLEDAFIVVRAWGFRPAQLLTWCKPPQGIGPGGAFASITEFILFARRGTLKAQQRLDRNWWEWSRGEHSVKPAAFLDVVEAVSPGPYAELFARQPRFGWDTWGYGFESEASA